MVCFFENKKNITVTNLFQNKLNESNSQTNSKRNSNSKENNFWVVPDN